MRTKYLMLFLMISLLLVGGCAEISDPCKSQFENCNYGCGEGWLSGACKEKCSYDYRQCQEDDR